MAENLQTIDLRDEVDQMLDKALSHERDALSREQFFRLLAEKRASLITDIQELLISSYLSYLSEENSIGDIWARRHWELPQSGIYTHPITGTTIALSAGGEERHPPRQTQLQEEVEKLRSENSTLRKKVSSLQDEVISFYDVVQFAAIVVFFLCTLSIPVWLGFDICLLSPLLSIAGIMGASAFWLMSWISKREFIKGKTSNNIS